MTRVLQVLQNYPPEFQGGVERAVESLCGGLPSAGYDPVVLCGSELLSDAPALEEETHGSVRVLRARRGRVWRNPIDPFDAGISRLFERVLDDVAPSIVHVHHWWNLSDDLVRRAARRGIETVVTLHDPFASCGLFFRNPDDTSICELEQSPENCGPCLAGKFHRAEAFVAREVGLRMKAFAAECRAASAVLAPSSFHADFMSRHLGGLGVEVLALGSSPIDGGPVPARARPEGELAILHFGNLSRIKGTQVLADAVGRLRGQGHAVTLRVAGSSMEHIELHGAEHAGDYDAASLRALAAVSDVAIFPSLANETYGLCVDEALRLGLPVVVSDRGALPERIGGRGAVIPADDVDALCATLERFVAEPGELDALRAAPMPELQDAGDHVTSVAAVYDRLAYRDAADGAAVAVEQPLLDRLENQAEVLAGLIAAAEATSPVTESDMSTSASSAGADPADSSINPQVPVDETGDLVSVIIRTRNRPRMLAEALESVAAQSWPHREAIVCNDGGEPVDGIVDAVRDRLDVTLLNPGGVGRCRAANHAIEHARGTWISWLDDDDIYLPDHLENLVKASQEQGLDVAYSDSVRLWVTADDDGGWQEVRRDEPHPKRPFDRLKLFGMMPFHLVSMFQHRRTLEHLGGFDPSLEVLEDMDLIFRLAQAYEPTRVPGTTAMYRIRDDESNAVTALKLEFMDTRTRLLQRYGHIVMPSLAQAMEEGQDHIAGLLRRISDLEAEVNRLRGEERS